MSLYVDHTGDRRYDYKDASGNQLEIIGEANLFGTLPKESRQHFMRFLVTRSWSAVALVIGFPTLKKWGIVSSSLCQMLREDVLEDYARAFRNDLITHHLQIGKMPGHYHIILWVSLMLL